MCAEKITVRQGEAWITEEHLQIRALLDRIGPISDPHALLPLLRELKALMDGHCHREEGDEGLHAIISENAPEHTATVDRLLGEHQGILTRIDDLIRECNACVAGPLTGIKNDRNRLIKEIQHHDAVESEILTDALLQEVGKAKK
jgi:hypothetical protein